MSFQMYPLKFTDEEFLILYNKGLHDAEIARQLSVAWSTVYKRRKALNLPPNLAPSWRRTKKLTKNILEQKYLTERKSIGIIAEEFGVCPSSILKYLKKYEIPLHKDIGLRENRGLIKLTCDLCGRTFFRKKSQVKPYKKHYCSSECARKAGQKRLTVVCEYCGKKFQRKVSQVNAFKHHFCSQRCYQMSKIKEVTCDECGKKFPVGEKSLNLYDKHFCSKDCMLKHLPKINDAKRRGSILHKAWYEQNYNERLFICRQLPDFMQVTPEGKIYFIELKTGKSHLNVNQDKVFTNLKRLGFPIIIKRFVNGEWVDDS